MTLKYRALKRDEVQRFMNTSEMDAELDPYQFLGTYYNKKAFTLSNDKTTASYIGSDDSACLAMTRPIGHEHRLILNLHGPDDVDLYFTTCDAASLLANSKHLINWCGSDYCIGRHVPVGRALSEGSQLNIRRTTDNRIEIVVIDASGGSSTEHVTTDEPVVPVISFRKIYQSMKFCRMRQDCVLKSML